jgi:hypothetical protein
MKQTMVKPRHQTSKVSAFRSGLEERIAHELRLQGVPFSFEEVVVPYVKRPATYTVDFLLKKNGILIETKGWFLSEDRTKHLLVKQQHPDLDIRFVFARHNSPLRAGSRTTYSTWAEKHGFAWAQASIPRAWIEEPPCPVRMAAAARFLRKAREQ